MVDALVSGASALRHVGSSPILGTRNKSNSTGLLLFRMPMGQLYMRFDPSSEALPIYPIKRSDPIYPINHRTKLW